MATLYVRSTDGSDTDNGSTWALAKATGAGAAAIDSAGDTIWFSDNHAESVDGAITEAYAGVVGNPVRLLSGDDSAEPPTALATTAVTATSGTSNNNDITLSGSFYCYGRTFDIGSSGNSAQMLLNSAAAHHEVFDACVLKCSGGGTSSHIFLGASTVSTGSITDLINCQFLRSSATQRISIQGQVNIYGGSFVSGGTTPAIVFNSSSTGEESLLRVVGLDFSNLGSTVNICEGGAITNGGQWTFAGCVMPSSWSGSFVSADITTPGYRVEAFACSAADAMYITRAHDCYGNLREETTLVRSGGYQTPSSEASGADPQSVSWKLDSSSHLPTYAGGTGFRSLSMALYNDTVGSAITITVPILFDDASDWNDNDIVLRVRYPGTAGSTLYGIADSGPSSVIAAATALNTKFGASSGWTTTGMSNAKQRQLQVTVTPREKGVIVCDVLLYKRAVCYVDPAPVVS